MKKRELLIISLALCVALLACALVGCKNKNNETEGTTAAPEIEATVSETVADSGTNETEVTTGAVDTDGSQATEGTTEGNKSRPYTWVSLLLNPRPKLSLEAISATA